MVPIMKEAIPQMVFMVVLIINLTASLLDENRNFKASLISTGILVAITYWGGFFQPLFIFINSLNSRM
jgi:antibiotic biosynthesis monooxygenase (ABM) superfamily enzyme